MTSISYKLPYPPSVNRIWRSYNGRVVKSAEYKKWLDAAFWSVKEKGTPNAFDAYSVSIIVYPPDKRKRDVDNVCKAILDALTNAKVWEDDSLVVDLRVRKGEVVKGGACKVDVKETKEEAPKWER